MQEFKLSCSVSREFFVCLFLLFFVVLSINKNESQKHVELFISYYDILLYMWFDLVFKND